jgi:putative acetyltransferase
MEIREDDLTGSQIAELLREHLASIQEITPPESIHALDLERLRSPEITFWTMWAGEELLGCGALRQLDPTSGEVKSMRTVESYRRQGVAAKMLEHIIAVAKQRTYDRLYAETGSFAEFAPARNLYAKYGFEYCNPFAEYTEDPNSVFMIKKLDR